MKKQVEQIIVTRLSLYIITGILLIGPGCAYKKIQPREEYHVIETYARDTFNQRTCLKGDEITADLIAQTMATGMSREQAIGIALQNSGTLESKFSDIGVAKADLVQAGLFTNPQLNSAFLFPVSQKERKDLGTEIYLDLTWNIADLWQVPRRKKVSQDQLALVTFDIMNTILDTRLNAQTAYNRCLCARAELQNVQDTLVCVKRLYQELYKRKESQESEKITDLDIYLAQVLVNSIEAELIKAQGEQKNAFVDFAVVLGLIPSTDVLLLTDQLMTAIADECDVNWRIPDSHPQLLKAQMRIQQEKHKKSYEESRFLSDVQVGFSYNNQPIDGLLPNDPPFIGPAIYLPLPIFDNRRAQIARAQFLMQQAESDYVNVRDALTAQLKTACDNMIVARDTISQYKKIIKLYEKALDYTDKHGEVFELDRLVGLNTESQLFETKKKMLEAYNQYHNAYARLEYALGKKL